MKTKRLEELKKMLEELKGDLTGDLMKEIAPEFKILAETDEKREGFKLEVKGNKASLQYALSEIINKFLKEGIMTKNQLEFVVKMALEED